MSSPRVARRYAEALFDLGRERGALEAYAAELARVAQAVRDEPRLRALLENPRVPQARKQQLLEEAFADLQPAVRNLLRLLVRKRRETYIGAVAAELERLRDQAAGIAAAEVRVAVPLAEDETERLQRRLERAFGRRLRLSVRVQPELIGGLVVQVGDRRIDASLRRRLQALRERIATGGAAGPAAD